MPDFTRLKAVLLSSSIQQQNPALYQVIDSLLTFLGNTDGKNLADAISGSGSAGPAGPIGPSGPIGIFGLDGIDGNDGSPGSIGPTGATGATGASGAAGATGIGIPGIDGIDGDDIFSIIPFLSPTQLLDLLGAAQGSLIYRDSTQWKLLSPGTSGYFLQTLGAGANPAWVSAAIGGGSLYSGTGNPQGVVSAAIGSLYQDGGTGYIYRKVGGGSTAYGWYVQNNPGGQPNGPLPWSCVVATGANPFSQVSSNGMFSGDAVNAITATNLNNNVRVIVSSKTYASAQTIATSGDVSGINTATTATMRTLDDDIDFWIDMRTGASVAAIRIWFGISSATPADTATLGSAASGSIAIRFCTPEGDAGWRGATQINGAGNQTLTSNAGSALAAIAANSNYRLRVRFVRQGTPTCYFSVNDGTEVSITTNIPLTGANYFPVFCWSTQANVLKAMLYRQIGAAVGS